MKTSSAKYKDKPNPLKAGKVVGKSLAYEEADKEAWSERKQTYAIMFYLFLLYLSVHFMSDTNRKKKKTLLWPWSEKINPGKLRLR